MSKGEIVEIKGELVAIKEQKSTKSGKKYKLLNFKDGTVASCFGTLPEWVKPPIVIVLRAWKNEYDGKLRYNSVLDDDGQAEITGFGIEEKGQTVLETEAVFKVPAGCKKVILELA